MKFQFSGLKDYMELRGCIPKCTEDEFFDIYTSFPGGVPGNTTVTYVVEFIATDVGVADWSLLMYENDDEDFYYGTGSIVIR